MLRHVLVTGANKGIGLAIVRRCLLDYDDVHAVLACRSLERGQGAIDELIKLNPAWEERMTLLALDTGSDESVRSAASKLSSFLGSNLLYGICNNAGIAQGSLEEIFQVNVRGPKRVVDAFLPMLDQQGRVVNISSGAASGCVSKCSDDRKAFFIDPDVSWSSIDGLINDVVLFPGGVSDFEANGLGVSMGGYGLSKALLNCYTILLAREHPGLKVNSCSPGMIETDLIKGVAPGWIPGCAKSFIAKHIMGAKSPDEGTVAPMHLLFADLQGNGWYYGSDAKRSPLDVYRSPGSPEYAGSRL